MHLIIGGREDSNGRWEAEKPPQADHLPWSQGRTLWFRAPHIAESCKQSCLGPGNSPQPHNSTSGTLAGHKKGRSLNKRALSDQRRRTGRRGPGQGPGRGHRPRNARELRLSRAAAQGPGISSIPPAQDTLLFCPGAPAVPHCPAPDPGAPGPLSQTGRPTTQRAQGLRRGPSLGCLPIPPPVGIPKGTQFVLWQPIPRPQSRKLCSAPSLTQAAALPS